MLDSSDTSDRLKLLKYYKPATGGPSFWYDTGTGNTTDKYGSNLTGTFLKAGDSSKVVGTGTSFLSEIKAGDVLQLGTEDIRVASVKSDTILFLSSATSTTHNGVTGKIPNIRIDKKNDCVIARIYKTGANAYSRFNYAKRSAIGSIDGIDGDPALSARLTASQYVIPYDSTDNEATTITFTATATNFATGNRTYKFYVDNVLKQTTTNTLDTHTFVLADGDEPANGSQKTIKLEIIQGSTTAIDSTSIYGVKDGESAFTVVFTNEAHTISADEGGAPLTFANSGTDIRVFKGSTRLTYATSGANTFEVAVLSDTDITVNASPTTEQFAIANDTRRYGIASGMANADTSASITYSITARSDDAIDTVLTKVQSFTKGNAGPGAKVVNLTASKYVIPYTLADTESTTITLTATAKNTSGSKIYKFYVDNTLITATGGTQTTAGNAVTCTIPDSLEPANGEQITVRVDVTSNGTIVASDSTSIYGVKDGSDAFTVILTNEAHTIPATSAGVPRTYANSGADIRVFLGSTALAYNTSGANTFNVTATSGNDIDPNASPTTVSTYTRRYGIASGMLNSAFADFITYTIVARNGEGTATTFTKIQSFTKGNDGVDADALTITGTTTTNGVTTITFSDTTSVSVADKGVEALYAASANPTLWSQINQTSGDYVNFYEHSGTFTTLSNAQVTALTFVKVLGESGDSEGVIPVYASNAGGSNKSFSITDSAYTNREYVNFYEWSGTKPAIGDSRITALNTFVKFVGDSFKTVEIFKLNDTTVGGNAASQTYATPVAGLETLWSTTQPALGSDGDKVYMSRRTFTADGLSASGNETSWSAPVVVAERNDSDVQGPVGPDGLRTIQGYLYYEKTTANNPPSPAVNVYNFSSGDITDGGSGTSRVLDSGTTNVWKNSPNTQDATSSNTYYTVRYYGTEAAAESSTITVAYSAIVQHTSFTGVVTFSSGTLTDGTTSTTPVEASGVAAAVNANSTTIDGGKITTNSIDANRLSIGEEDRTASRLLLLSDSLKIFSGNTLRVHIGNLSNTDT